MSKTWIIRTYGAAVVVSLSACRHPLAIRVRRSVGLSVFDHVVDGDVLGAGLRPAGALNGGATG
jgi:hypothetical protein